MSLLDFYEVPLNTVVLLYGPPGSGKSTFCRDAAVSRLRQHAGPIIYITTELLPEEIFQYMSQKGLRQEQLNEMWVMDGTQSTPSAASDNGNQRIVSVDCTDLTGIGVKLSELSGAIGRNNIMLIFDSLSSPYLFNENAFLKFVRATLARFALMGNRVLASIDEGCGKREDLVALQSISNGIIRIEPKKDRRILNVMKFPGKTPLSLDYILRGGIEPVPYRIENPFVGQWTVTREKALSGTMLRHEMNDSVNLIWYQLALWGGMLWDKRFPALMYNFGKDLSYQLTLQTMPSIVSQNPELKNEKDFIEFVSALNPILISATKKLGGSDLYFINDISHKDEIHYGWNESAICFAFPNVNSALCYFYSGSIAGAAKAVSTFLGKPKSWDATEYMCLGLGNNTCRARVVETGSDDLKGYLESIDNVRIERLNDRINEQMASHLLQRKPPVERRKLGVEMHVAHFQESITLPSLSCDFFRRALSNAGVNSGMKLASYLQERGLSSDEAVRQLGNFLSYTKVGEVTLGENLRIIGNAETLGLSSGLPICSFTTGFLSGFASTVKGAKVVEDSCQSSGAQYCEFVFTRV
jgi:predicted hydrocarbon binding protein/KaiC/GvpD/RAD55 family RecA-like ATPase